VLDSLARMQQAGLRLGVCTNKAERFTTPLLAQKNLTPFFSTVICGDTCPTKKPAPEMIYAGAAGLELEASELLMVGDSRNDAEAARAAGCPVLILPYGYNEGQSVRELDCDGIVESFKHIADLLIQA
jgi:phosphoglycolate phosphatase